MLRKKRKRRPKVAVEELPPESPEPIRKNFFLFNEWVFWKRDRRGRLKRHVIKTARKRHKQFRGKILGSS